MCSHLIFLFFGYSSHRIDKVSSSCICFQYFLLNIISFKKTLPVIYGHALNGASTMQIAHFIQLYKSGYFRKFDFGPLDNSQHYGVAKPPKYILNRVRVPVTIYYGSTDALTTPTDVLRTANELPNVRDKILIDGYNHGDFLWAGDAHSLVYQSVKNSLEQY